MSDYTDMADWQRSLEKEFLLQCPACSYIFPDTLSIVSGKQSGRIICKRCGEDIYWQEHRKYTCKVIPREL